MSSFLEKLNQQAASGSISTPKAPAEKTVKAPAPEVNANTSDQNKKAAAQPAETTKPATGSISRDTHTFSAAPAVSQQAGIRSTEHDIEIDRSYGTKRFLRIIATVLVCVILIAAGVMAFRYFTMVTLPDFTGKTIAEMRKWCIDNNLYLTETSVFSMDVKENYIISQSELGGSKLNPKTTIDVTYSLGADPDTRIQVPDLINMKASEIREWIEENLLSNVNIYEEYSTTVAKGAVSRYVFNSITVDETNFKRSDSLTVYVSRGASTSYNAREVKDFKGVLKSEVDSWCSTNGMIAAYTVIMSDTVGENRIISQSVEAGTMLEPGATIEFVLSEGPGLIIPDYSDVKQSDAPSYASGVTVTIKNVYSLTVPYGDFISQSVAAGTRVRKAENAVTISYSIGKPWLPNFVGMSEADLPRLFYEINAKGAHLSYMITYVISTQTKGTIVEASHGLEFTELDTLVDIRVSNGLGTVTNDPNPGNPITYVIVPDYSQVLKENAAAVNRNISVTIVMNYSDTVAYGKLISQSVRAGSAVTSDDNQVTLIYSAGKPFIGDLNGKNENELPAIFYEFSKMGANVTYVVTYVDNTAAKGTIVYVSKSNEYISATEVIQIQVSKG